MYKVYGLKKNVPNIHTMSMSSENVTRYLLSPVEQPLATGLCAERLNKALSDFFYFGELADPRNSGTAPVHRSDLNPHLGFESPAT